MRFKGSSKFLSGGIKAECDGLCVLLGSVKCIAKIHKEGVALPKETVLDISVGEPSAVEEVCRCDADRVTGPCEEVPVASGYVEDLVCHVPEEGRDLGSGDLLLFVSGRVEIYCPRAAAGSA